MTLEEATERICTLVEQGTMRANVIDMDLVVVRPHQHQFVVLWENDKEYGVHWAYLNHEVGRPDMLENGFYTKDYVRAREEFQRRAPVRIIR